MSMHGSESSVPSARPSEVARYEQPLRPRSAGATLGEAKLASSAASTSETLLASVLSEWVNSADSDVVALHTSRMCVTVCLLTTSGGTAVCNQDSKPAVPGVESAVPEVSDAPHVRNCL